MKTKHNKPKTVRERRWVLFNNGCIHGLQHSELLVVRSVPHRSIVQDTVSVAGEDGSSKIEVWGSDENGSSQLGPVDLLSSNCDLRPKTFGFIAALAAVVMLVLLLAACAMPHPQKGGGATSTISRPGAGARTLAAGQAPGRAEKGSPGPEKKPRELPWI